MKVLKFQIFAAALVMLSTNAFADLGNGSVGSALIGTVLPSKTEGVDSDGKLRFAFASTHARRSYRYSVDIIELRNPSGNAVALMKETSRNNVPLAMLRGRYAPAVPACQFYLSDHMEANQVPTFEHALPVQSCAGFRTAFDAFDRATAKCPVNVVIDVKTGAIESATPVCPDPADIAPPETRVTATGAVYRLDRQAPASLQPAYRDPRGLLWSAVLSREATSDKAQQICSHLSEKIPRVRLPTHEELLALAQDMTPVTVDRTRHFPAMDLTKPAIPAFDASRLNFGLEDNHTLWSSGVPDQSISWTQGSNHFEGIKVVFFEPKPKGFAVCVVDP